MLRGATHATRTATAALLGVLAGLSLTSSVASASVRPSDLSATRAFLGAYNRYLKSVPANIPKEEESRGALAQAISRECQGILVRSPGTRGLEVAALAMIAVDDQAVSPLYRALAREIGKLRWSNPTLTRFVHADVQLLNEEAPMITAPQVCGELRAWVASKYRSKLSAALSEPPPDFFPATGQMHLLRAYEGPRLRSEARRIEHLESSVSTRQNTAFGNDPAIDNALGV